MRWVAALLALTFPAAADEVAMEKAWRGWVAEFGATQSTIAIAFEGEVLRVDGIGMPANAAAPLASLSKAVTGACILAMESEGLLSVSDTLADHLQDRPDLLPDADPARQITLASLLTHSSGIDFDATQRLINPTLWGGPDWHDRVSAAALARPLGERIFFYNNENFAILGSIIKEITGETVDAACAPRVLQGLSTAAPHRLTGGGLAWGGWEMSAADYLRFANTLEYAPDWPMVEVGPAVSYGPGVLVRDTQSGQNLWHFGGYCVAPPLDNGSYFFVLDSGWSVAVTYNICASQEATNAIDSRLGIATR